MPVAAINVEHQGQQHWWANYESWIVNHRLWVSYIGGGVLFVMMLTIFGICWRKRQNKKREWIQKLTVQPVKSVKSISPISIKVDSDGGVASTTMDTNKNCEEYSNDVHGPIMDVAKWSAESSQNQSQKSPHSIIHVKEAKLITPTGKDNDMEKTKDRTDKETKKEVRFAPNVDQMPSTQDGTLPMTAIAIAMSLNLNQSESKFSEMYYNDSDDNPNVHAMATIFEKEPMSEMIPPAQQLQPQHEAMLNATETERKVAADISAMYGSNPRSNGYAIDKAHRNTHRTETQDTDLSGMYGIYAPAEVLAANQPFSRTSELIKTRVLPPEEEVRVHRGQTYTTTPDHPDREQSHFSQMYGTYKEHETNL